MKKVLSILIALVLTLGCAAAFAETEAEAFAKLPEEIQIDYGSTVELYVNGIQAVKNPDGSLTDDELAELKEDLGLAAECDFVGYAITDLNGDGKDDLVIASGTLILAVYSYGTDENGEYVSFPVMESTETVRFYYAGEGKFADVTLVNGEPAYETACVWTADGEIPDLGPENRVAPEYYQQLALFPVYPLAD